MSHTDCPEVFDEDALSLDDALGASERFIAWRSDRGIAFRLGRPEEANTARLVSRDEIVHLLTKQLDRGAQIELLD